MYFLLRYGSGEYKIYLNDAGLAASKDRISNRGISARLCFGVDSAIRRSSIPAAQIKVLDLDWKHLQTPATLRNCERKESIPRERNEEDVPNDVVKTLVDKVGRWPTR